MYTPIQHIIDTDSDVHGALANIVQIPELSECPPSTMWYLCGETPDSFMDLAGQIRHILHPPSGIDADHALLLTLIWMRHNWTYKTLGMEFGSIFIVRYTMKFGVGYILTFGVGYIMNFIVGYVIIRPPHPIPRARPK